MTGTPDAATRAALVTHGFTRLAADEARRQLGIDAKAFSAFAASWHDLDIDDYMADGGRYRRRRHAVFTVGDDTVTRGVHQPHYQSRDYNTLNGGIERWFTPVAEAVADDAVLHTLLVRFGALFADAGAAAPGAAGVAEAGDETAATDGATSWTVEMHQFRIEAHPHHAGQPTPEGMHRDGVDWVAVVMVGRTNVAGGVTAVADADGTVLGSFTLTDPLDTVLLDDHRVWHGVTPVVPLDPAAPAYRDVLVLTYRHPRHGVPG